MKWLRAVADCCQYVPSMMFKIYCSGYEKHGDPGPRVECLGLGPYHTWQPSRLGTASAASLPAQNKT
jgi:hypothetical protein